MILLMLLYAVSVCFAWVLPVAIISLFAETALEVFVIASFFTAVLGVAAGRFIARNFQMRTRMPSGTGNATGRT